MNKIEDFAPTYLTFYYQQHHNAKDVFVYVHEKAKNGDTADSLFTFSKGEEEPFFTATLNTTLSIKLSDLLGNFRRNKLKTPFLIISLLATLLIASGSYWLSGNIFVPALAFTLFPVSYFCLKAFHWIFCKRQLLKMVNLLKRLPANQKWIGLSISSQKFKHNKLAESFLSICKEKGIGVITVGKRSKVVLMLEPKSYYRRSGDFLSFYKSEFTIRKAVLADKIMRVA